MTFIVATNVVASRPPERRPTGTPHARANLTDFLITLLILTVLDPEIVFSFLKGSEFFHHLCTSPSNTCIVGHQKLMKTSTR